jgi:uncharacterized protein YaaN involved in tellurite resistance
MNEMNMQQQLSLPDNYKHKMTPDIARKVTALKATIDMHDRDKVIAYGREQQASISKFSDSILQGTSTAAVGEAGDLLTGVISKINGYNDICNKKDTGFFAFLRKQKSNLFELQTKYKSLADNMDTVVKDLQTKDLALGQVSRSFDVMYEENLQTYNYLTMVIYAGELALQEEKQKLSNMQKAAENSGDLMEIQKVSDFNDDILSFERRLYDLKLSRVVAIQQAPQIRNIQRGAIQVSESIKTTIATSIPLWKSQMAIALGMQQVQQGLNAVNAVRDATNAMLIANAQMNKQMTLEAAQAVEKGVIDIETINVVNKNLIDSLNGSYEIAQKAIAEREEGAKKLRDNEAELKQAIIQYTI